MAAPQEDEETEVKVADRKKASNNNPHKSTLVFLCDQRLGWDWDKYSVEMLSRSSSWPSKEEFSLLAFA